VLDPRVGMVQVVGLLLVEDSLKTVDAFRDVEVCVEEGTSRVVAPLAVVCMLNVVGMIKLLNTEDSWDDELLLEMLGSGTI
jgi:hypothetical protein